MCAHSVFPILAVAHIPAIIIHGNTLSLEEYGCWYTPAHIMGGGNWKLHRHSEIEGTHKIHAPPKTAPASIETPPEEKPDGPRGQLKLF
jgi:hypothetical protein